jgi:hypothetical protein
MKITKQKLKQIIKEELSEAPRYKDPTAQLYAKQTGQKLYTDLTDKQGAALAALEEAVNNALEAGLTDADIRDTIESRTMS